MECLDELPKNRKRFFVLNELGRPDLAGNWGGCLKEIFKTH